MKNLNLTPHTFMAFIIAMALFAVISPAGAQTFLDIDFENQTVGTKMYLSTSNPFAGTPNIGTIDTTLNNDTGNQHHSGVLQVQNAELTRSSGKVFILEAEYADGASYTGSRTYADDLNTSLDADRARAPGVEFFTSSTASIANNPILSSRPLYASFDLGRLLEYESSQLRFITIENSSGQELFRVAPVYSNDPTRIEYGNGGVFLADIATVGFFGRPNLGESMSYLFTLDLAAGTFRLDVDSELVGRDWSTGDLAFLNTAGAYNVNSLAFTGVAEVGGQIWELDNVLIFAVPEPSTVLLLVCGAGLLWRFRRRK